MTPDELTAILTVLLPPHRVVQAATQASRCYAEDTCTMDPGCPFAAHCVEVESRKDTPW